MNIIPLKYNITIHPTKPHFNHFVGRCEILFNHNVVDLNILSFDCTNLNITNAIIYSIDNSYEYQHINYKDKSVDIVFSHIPINSSIVIDYIGVINDQPFGLFKTYVNNNLLIYSMFEPNFAKYCFPCIDLPSHKSKFIINIVSDNNSSVLSNMPISQIDKIDNDNYIFSFIETPLMSTYLVSLYIEINSNIKNITHKTKNNVKISIYDREICLFHNLLLKCAVECIDYLEKLLDSKFVLPKLDIVYVPKFIMGGMENFGLIFIRKISDKMYNFTEISIDNMNIVITLIHEIVHQWFGNLVTMYDWYDIWLNEGITTWLSWIIAANIFNDIPVYEYIYVKYITKMIDESAMTHSYPVVNCNFDIDEIRNVFNIFTYIKGANNMFMIANYIGTKNIVKILRKYIKKLSFKSATTKIFFEIVKKVSGTDISKIFWPWFYKKNGPILNVKLIKNNVEIVQNKFAFIKNNEDVFWPIPILLNQSYLLNNFNSNYQNKYTITNKKEIHSIDILKYINSEFYVTNYDFNCLKIVLDNNSTTNIIKTLFNNFVCLKYRYIHPKKYLRNLEYILSKIDDYDKNIFKLIRKHFVYLSKNSNKKFIYHNFNIIVNSIPKNKIQILQNEFDKIIQINRKISKQALQRFNQQLDLNNLNCIEIASKNIVLYYQLITFLKKKWYILRFDKNIFNKIDHIIKEYPITDKNKLFKIENIYSNNQISEHLIINTRLHDFINLNM